MLVVVFEATAPYLNVEGVSPYLVEGVSTCSVEMTLKTANVWFPWLLHTQQPQQMHMELQPLWHSRKVDQKQLRQR